ncbi:MAG: type II secretion system F family protein [Chloroflexi bacterium]|nr:type II secretion system F family protein [Chloroflexota bacterium]
MAIAYVAYNENGDRVVGSIEVESVERAREALWASNLVILSLKKERRFSLSEQIPTLFGVKAVDIITFTRELASLLESGISLVPGLRVIHDMTEKQALRTAIAAVIRDVEAGKSFSQSCSGQTGVFPGFYIRLLEVAEETGELRKSLLEIVSHMERQRAIAGKIRKALSYPAVVFMVGSVAAVLLITVAMPSLTGLLTEYGVEVPLATRILIGLGSAGQAFGKQLLIAAGVLALAGWQYARTPGGRRRFDKLLLKVPLIGTVIRYSELARLCSSLATMLQAGLPTAEALRLSIEAVGNSVFREGLTHVYREVLTGSRMETAIMRQPAFPRLLSQTVGVGEAAGSLKVNLAGLANFYEQETERTTSRTTDMIEPAMIIIIGIVVGFIGVAIISAVYSIIPQIK